jgi:hypothetical protein
MIDLIAYDERFNLTSRAAVFIMKKLSRDGSLRGKTSHRDIRNPDRKYRKVKV